MQKKWIILISTAATISSSCSDCLLGPDPENTPLENFEILWEEFDKTYPFFVQLGIDWDAMHAEYRCQITAGTTDEDLFHIVLDMLHAMQDGHLLLHTPYGSQCCWTPSRFYRYRENFLGIEHIKSRYMDNISEIGGVTYGLLSGGVGYLYISSFEGRREDYYHIDDILQRYQTRRGFVVDVRSNGGGTGEYANVIASRFADKVRIYGYNRYRNGPKHTDFTDYVPRYIKPGGAMQFTKPVALLTNRYCASSSEAFVQMLGTLPHVTVFGDTTAGVMVGPRLRELPNGWVYGFASHALFGADKRCYEGIGIPPDTVVAIPETDASAGIDTILEEALRMLSR